MFEITPVLTIGLMFALGVAGALVFDAFKMPAPYILGPIVAVSLGNIFELPIPMLPGWFESIAQIVLGFYLGIGITRKNLRQLKSASFPAAVIAVWSLVITFALGFFLYQATPLNLATAVLSSSPGGAPEVSIVAVAVNADVATVTIMQLARLLAILILAPLLSKLVRSHKKTVSSACSYDHFNPEGLEDVSSNFASGDRIRTIFLRLCNPGLAIAVAGGLVLNFFGIPAGYMIGAMVAVGAASLYGVKINMPPEQLRLASYIGIGLLIGQFFTREAFVGIADIYPVVLLLTAIMLLSCAALGLVISKITGWRLSVCLLATAPGGLITMIALAAEMDSDPFIVSLMHLSRLITVKLTLPLVLLIIS